jgi:hypothetical protein
VTKRKKRRAHSCGIDIHDALDHRATGPRNYRPENSRANRPNDPRKILSADAAEKFAAEILQTVPRVCRRYNQDERAFYIKDLCVAEQEIFELTVRLGEIAL